MHNNKITTDIRRLGVILKYFSYVFMIAFGGCQLFSEPLFAEDGKTGNLINVKWLEKNLDHKDLLILDASPSKLYSAKHIAGAVGVDVFGWYGLQEMQPAEIEKIYQSWGISKGKKIVIYDQGGAIWGTLLFYSLYYYGYPLEDLYFLDGGLFKWEAEGFPVTADKTTLPERGTFSVNNVNEDIKVRLPEFVTASGDRENSVLLEALGADWHFGEVKSFNRAGHIPNAVMLPAADFYNEDKTFKSGEEIQKMLSYLNIKPEQKILTHCGGGVAASVPFFALKTILNYPNVKLFKESQLGWLRDERELPFWTYDTPSLIREPGWLQFWGGRMIRMFGGGNVSMLDIRSAEEFKNGHLPFAVNIPAEQFYSNINNPEKITELLGPVGVNASHEAVIISGSGLTKESALAFVMLEKLGQNKVSFFTESFDNWTKLGFTVEKDTAPADPKKNGGLSTSTKGYLSDLRRGVLISDPNSTKGIYPKVFIASGKEMPSKTGDGKVVHVPYTDLLNADGSPKAAKDIWNILIKAGVPRYGELICFSEDNREAAVNYLILKLMGYPDIKVLVN